jgi:hypothetical protein
MTAAAATIVAALHVSERIKDYGSYAGFACVLGLAVLSLLYFAQAREVKRLREWAGRAPERDAELQARVTAEAQQRAAGAIAPAATAATAPKPATAAATPAGQAQPVAATAQQQQQQPAGAPAQQPADKPAAQPAATPKPGVPAPATAAAAAAGAASAASASPVTAKPDAPKGGDGAMPPPSTPTPPTPVGAAPSNGAVDQPTQITPAPAAASTPKPAPKPGQPLRPPTPAPVAAQEHESPLRTTLMIVGGVLAVAVVVLVLVLTVFNGSSNTSKPNTIGNAPATTTNSPSKTGSNATKTQPISRGDVNVAVLNGTTIPGLAREVGTKLQTAGFKLGTVTNAPDQARSATVVAYQPGHINEARVVARLIHVGSDAVKPIDQSTAVVAGQDAFVVVTVGADQSQ